MYIVSTLWKFGSPGQANEAIRRLRDSFGPLVRAQGGFRSWYLAASGVDEAVSLTLWESRAAYEKAQEQLAAWGQEHLAELDARVQYRRRGDLAAYEGP
jgi:heme-degrading monooxygenase HmoA